MSSPTAAAAAAGGGVDLAALKPAEILAAQFLTPLHAHPLAKTEAVSARRVTTARCNGCRAGGAITVTCARCDFDLCGPCFQASMPSIRLADGRTALLPPKSGSGAPATEVTVVCTRHAHPLVHLPRRVSAGRFICNLCRGSPILYSCLSCDFDVCRRCLLATLPKQDLTPSESKQIDVAKASADTLLDIIRKVQAAPSLGDASTITVDGARADAELVQEIYRFVKANPAATPEALATLIGAAVKQAVKEEVTSAGKEVLADVVKDAAIGMHVHLDPTGLSQIIRIGRLVKEGKLGQAAASAVWHAVVGKIVLGALCVVQ